MEGLIVNVIDTVFVFHCVWVWLIALRSYSSCGKSNWASRRAKDFLLSCVDQQNLKRYPRNLLSLCSSCKIFCFGLFPPRKKDRLNFSFPLSCVTPWHTGAKNDMTNNARTSKSCSKIPVKYHFKKKISEKLCVDWQLFKRMAWLG